MVALGQSDKVIDIRRQAESLPPIKFTLDELVAGVKGGLLEAERQKATRRNLALVESGEPIAKPTREVQDILGMTPSQRQALRAQILAWEAEAEWRPLAFVALEQVDTCLGCGGVSAHLVGLYQQQEKRIGKAQRFVLWAPQEATDTKLPRSFLSVERSVALCPRCLWQQGFVEKYEGEVRP